MKKKTLLVLGFSAGMLLAACAGQGTPTTSDSGTTTDDTVYATGIEIVAYGTQDPIDVLNISLTENGDVDTIITPTNAEDKTVTWSVSEEGILDLAEIEYGTVEGLKAGTVTLTATANGAAAGQTVSDSITVNVSKYTHADINDLSSLEGGHVYAFSGILEDLDHTDKHGNAYVTDPETGATVQLYGATTTESALVETGGTWKYTNPKDAVTTLADYENGDEVTGYGLWEADFGNFKAILTGHEASSRTYAASVDAAIENGTATLSKETGLAYGETVTVTTTPESGYTVSNVTVATAYGQLPATMTAENTYTFPATCKNVVSVVFYKQVSGQVSVDLTESSGNLAGFGLSTQYGAAEADIQDLHFAGTYMNVSAQSKWSENLLVLADNSSKVTAAEGGTLTITGATFTGIDVTYRWWAQPSDTFSIQYSNDGTQWTDLLNINMPNGVDYAEDQNYSSEGTEFTATYLRLCVNTDEKSNRRVGLVNITVFTA